MSLRGGDGVDGEVANFLAQVAPGVEIPVVAVVDQALRRDFALAFFAAATVVVTNLQALTLEQRRGDELEVLQVALALGGVQNADAFRDFLGCVVLAAEQTLKARQQWRDVRAEQTGLHFFEEVLHHE